MIVFYVYIAIHAYEFEAFVQRLISLAGVMIYDLTRNECIYCSFSSRCEVSATGALVC